MNKEPIASITNYLNLVLPFCTPADPLTVATVCSQHTKIEDSGIAVIWNALAIIYNMEFETDLSEFRCWKKRELFARQCLASAETNAEILTKAVPIWMAINEGDGMKRGTLVSLRSESGIREKLGIYLFVNMLMLSVICELEHSMKVWMPRLT